MVRPLTNTNTIIASIIGFLSFVFWCYPIYQDQHFWNYSERTNDFGGILTIPVTLLHTVGIASYSLAVILLLICGILSWLVLTIIAFVILNNFYSKVW